MAKKLTLVERMRANSTMAGIVALSEHYPPFISVGQQPTPATDYLYDSIIISGLDNITSPQHGMALFFISIINDILDKKIINSPDVELPNKCLKDAQILRSLRKQIKTDFLNTDELYRATAAWVSPHGGVGDDHYLFYTMRSSVHSWANSFLRAAIANIPRLSAEWSTAEYDWWHRLGTIISHLAHAYMASEWQDSGPPVPYIYDKNLSEAEQKDAYAQLKQARLEYEQMRWHYQELLFMRLANCIGDHAGRRPHKNPKWIYPDDLQSGVSCVTKQE